MEQILLAYGPSKETVTVIMMLYKNTKAMVHSPNGNTDFFDIVTGILQENTLAPFIFTIYQDYGLEMLIDLIKENGFRLKKDKKLTKSHHNIPQNSSCTATYFPSLKISK